MPVFEDTPDAARADHIQWARDMAMPFLNRGDYVSAYVNFASAVRQLGEDRDRFELAYGRDLLETTDRLTVLSVMRHWIEAYT